MRSLHYAGVGSAWVAPRAELQAMTDVMKSQKKTLADAVSSMSIYADEVGSVDQRLPQLVRLVTLCLLRKVDPRS